MNLKEIVFGRWELHSKVINRDTKEMVNVQVKPVDILAEAYPSLYFDAHKREHILTKLLEVLDKRINAFKREEKLEEESKELMEAIKLEEKEKAEFDSILDSINEEEKKKEKKNSRLKK